MKRHGLRLAVIGFWLAGCPAKERPPAPVAVKVEATPPRLSVAGSDPDKDAEAPIASIRIDTDADSTVTAAGKPVTTRKNGDLVALFDLEPSLAEADPRFLTDLSVHVPPIAVEVTATSPDHGVAKTTALLEPSVDARHALARRLAAVATRPLDWAAPYRPGSAPAIEIDLGTCAGTDERYADHGVFPYIVGSAPFARLRDVQLIAVVCDTPKFLETCRGYDNGGRIDRLQPVITATVYQAKTGEKVASATFEGFKAQCPRVWPDRKIEGAAPSDKVDAWLKKLTP